MRDELEDLVVFAATHYVAGDETMPAGDRLDRGRARASGSRELEARGQAARGPAPPDAHRARPRDAGRDRVVLGDRELQPPPRRPRSRASRPTRCSTTSPKDWLRRHRREPRRACPQLHGQYAGDRSRKDVLVEHGFRLPSALDNRPLRFEEFVERVHQVHLHVGDARRPTSSSVSDAGRRAGHPPDRARRPRGRRSSRPRARSTTCIAEIDDAVERRRAGARHDAHEEDGRGPLRLPPRAGRPGPVPALEHRHDRADRDPPRAAPRRVRRARRHQPAARGARPARGLARRDPRRRQGGLPALGHLAHPDDGPGGAQRRRAAWSSTPTRSPTRCARRSR